MELDFFSYKIPFTKPFTTAANRFTHREGIFISLKKDAITALGEAAPLPGFSTVTFNELTAQTQRKRPRIKAFFQSTFSLDDVREFINSQNFSPSLQFGLFTVAATYLAQKNACALHELLFQDAANAISINAVISTGAVSSKQVNQYVSQGFGTIKIKISPNWKLLARQLKAIRSNHPELAIRIDANQSWSLEEAISNLQQATEYRIEYCEEPLANPDKISVTKLTRNAAIPIALDESLAASLSIQEALELASVLIIKPMVLGNVCLNKKLIKRANKVGAKLVFTTSLESGLGRLMTATLAAGLGTRGIAHGLETGSLLKNDIWSDDHFIKNGQFYLPGADQLSKLMNRNLSDLSATKL